MQVTTPEGRGVKLISVQVMPRRKGPALVAGRLWFDAAEADLVRFSFRFVGTELWYDPDEEGEKDARRINRIVSRILTLDADLEYALQGERSWMPYRQVVSGRVELPWLGSVVVPFEARTTFDDYTLNRGVPIAFTTPLPPEGGDPLHLEELARQRRDGQEFPAIELRFSRHHHLRRAAILQPHFRARRQRNLGAGEEALHPALHLAAEMRAGNDFLPGVAALLERDATEPVQVQHLRHPQSRGRTGDLGDACGDVLGAPFIARRALALRHRFAARGHHQLAHAAGIQRNVQAGAAGGFGIRTREAIGAPGRRGVLDAHPRPEHESLQVGAHGVGQFPWQHQQHMGVVQVQRAHEGDHAALRVVEPRQL